MGAIWQLHISVNVAALSSRRNHPQGAAPMPLMLTPAERAMLDGLAAPVDEDDALNS